MKMKRKYRINCEAYCTITGLYCEEEKCPEEYRTDCVFMEIIPIKPKEE